MSFIVGFVQPQIVVFSYLLIFPQILGVLTDRPIFKNSFLKKLFRDGRMTIEPPTPIEIAENYGYYGETHNVTTPDGYILGIHRIQNKSVQTTEPFIIQHGLTTSSGCWMGLEPERNIVFMLADAGYDIWLTNIRGNPYSRRHLRLTPDKSEFWDYGFHEHGTIDMPTMIDYVLSQTGYRQLYYIGHSMGTTMFFVMGSMRSEYNAKIKHMFAFAPVAYCGNMKSPVTVFAPQIRTYYELMKNFLNNHIPGETVAWYIGKQAVCEGDYPVCKSTADAICGYHPESNNEAALKTIIRYTPDAVSAKQLTHYGQYIANPFTFRLFDYYDKNLPTYGTTTPPDYPIQRITAPITLMYSRNDFLSAAEDVESFSQKVRTTKLFLVQDPLFNHADYLLADNAKELIYNAVLETANSYRKEKD